jgi:predicted RNA-binding Zn-ribbon protein involved in translation (DUF1610 family)
MSKAEKTIITKICSTIAQIKKENIDSQVEIENFDLKNNKFYSKYFKFIPIYSCSNCEMSHNPKCYHCNTILAWNSTEASFNCPECKKSYSEKLFLKCDENEQSSEYTINECLILAPKQEFIREIVEKINNVYDLNIKDYNFNFFIKNSILHCKLVNADTEINIGNILHFKDIDLEMRLNNKEEYKKYKEIVKR